MASPFEEHTHVARARKKRPPPPPSPPPPKYDAQVTGTKYIEFLNDPTNALNNPNCRIRQSTVTYQTLQDDGWTLKEKDTSVPHGPREMTMEMRMSQSKVYKNVQATLVKPDGKDRTTYDNTVGPGMIFALVIL